MAKQNKRPTQREQRTKCENSGCSKTFGRKCDRRRHMVEQHGRSPLYCSYPGCQFVTKRAGKLRSHLSSVHHREITTNLIIPSDFRIAPTHSQGSANHFSPLEVNMNINAIRPSPPGSTDHAFTSQPEPEIDEPHSALNNELSPPSEDSLMLRSLVASRKEVQSTSSGVYKTIRIRRRPPHPTTRTSSADPAQAQFGSAKEATPDISTSEQGSTSLYAQWMHCAWNVEPLSELLDSPSLDFRLTEDAIYEPTSYSDYSEALPFDS